MPQYKHGTDIVCLTYDEVVPAIMKRDNFYHHKRAGNLRVSCRGGFGSPILIEWNSLPERPTNYKEIAYTIYGDPKQAIAMNPMKNIVARDDAARKFYAEEYILPCGDPLPIDYQMKYSRQCDWFRAIKMVLNDKKTSKETLGISTKQIWKNFSNLINEDKYEEAGYDMGHGLPTSVDRLQRRYKLYRDKGYSGIVEAFRFGNDFARKVTPKIEGLILALYRIKHKPTHAEVHRFYNQFMAGALEIVDLQTGEVYNPEEFSNNGKAYKLSDSIISYYLSTPKNRAAIDKERMGALEYNNTYRPHMMRKGPFYAFSKVTMDDTSSPFKMLNGDRPATYKMFDVASTALIGMVMHDQARPDAALIRSLIMGVIGQIARKGWRMPAEIEVERAITSTMTGDSVNMDVLSAGAVFPYVRWCKAKNPQEKRAEGFIKQIKYQYQKHREGFQYRPFAKRTENKKNEDIKDSLFTFKEIHQFEMEDMMLYNSALHPDQETYPNMTRWQVLEQCQNPDLPILDLSLVMPYVGYKTKTSVRRMRIEVQYNKYELPKASVLADLSDPNVVAYYIPDERDLIPSVYVYQDGKFICEAKKAERFQEAKVEQTEEDLLILGRQKEYEAGFNNMVAEQLQSLAHIGVMKKGADTALIEDKEVAIVGIEGVMPEEEEVYTPDDDNSVVKRVNNLF